MSIKVFIRNDYQELSIKAAEIVEETVSDNPFPVLGLATGKTPTGLYRQLVADYSRGIISFSNVKTVNLDEYAGLSADDTRSFAFYMKKNLFSHIDILPQNTYIPNGATDDLSIECRRYSYILKNLKRDIQLLGIGSNGHIGFNEPGTPFDSTTYVVRLAESTRKDNSGAFGGMENVPEMAITMGISDIMSAKKILLLASGKNKASAVREMLLGKVSEDCPASILQRHPDATVILDRDASRLI